ncbi:MAG: pyrroline-5-carboxylate reductase dimerization domain-containing protein, partial [Planctomycetota bacterium]
VVRVMPNTPARVRLGMSCLALGAGAEEADAAFALRLFGAIGEVVRVDESLVDAFTALAGSGPAYAFLLAEAMAGAGRELGLDPGDADRAARQTLLGAATLLSSSDRSAAELRDAVTSRKGTTAAALDVFEAGGFRELVERAMTAARDRGRELSADA